MKDYDKNKESSYHKYWDVSYLYGWAISQKLPVNKFEWIKETSQFNEDFIKNYNEEGDERYFIDVDVQYPKKLHDFHNELPFLPERQKIKKVEQALNHGLILKKGHREIKFDQKGWLKPYIDMNTELRQKAKNNFSS